MSLRGRTLIVLLQLTLSADEPHFSLTMSRSRTSPLTVLSVFTGAGGLDLGLECAGFETVACIELDERARDTIVANRPHWNLQETGDVVHAAYELEPAAVGLAPGELSILAGGPPCQPFSTAAQWVTGQRPGVDDPRNLALLAFLHLAERFLPHTLLIENVPGFVIGRGSATSMILGELSRINAACGTRYTLEAQILNAEDYGVPQRRRRAILISRRDGQPFSWPKATHLERPVRTSDALYDLKPKELPVRRGQWAELLPTIPAGSNYQYHTAKGGGHALFGHRRWFWSFLLKLAPDRPSWTISAQGGPATGPFHWDNRPLAIEELARLQSFPRSWKFVGGNTAKRKQIGNATPPLLAEVIGRAIASSIFRRRYATRPRLSIPRRRVVVVAPEPVAVPSQFLGRINRQDAHPGVGRGPGAMRREAAHLLTEFAVALREFHCASTSGKRGDANGESIERTSDETSAGSVAALQPLKSFALSGLGDGERQTPKRVSRATRAA